MRTAWLAAIYALLSLLPLLLESMGVSRLISILTYGYIMSIYAVSFSLLLGYLGLLNFGHALFFGVGAYFTAYQIMWWGVPYLLAIPISMILGAAAGILISLMARRAFGGIPFAFISLTALIMIYMLYRRRELRAISGSEQGLLVPVPEIFRSTVMPYITLTVTSALAIASIYMAIRTRRHRPGERSASLVRSTAPAILALLLLPIFTLTIENIAGKSEALRVSPNLYIFSLTLLIAVILAMKRILESPLGLVWVSIRDNEARAASLGYDVFIYKATAMSISGAVAALSGSLYAVYAFNINPERTFDPLLSVYGLIYSLIGGLYPIEGSVVGAIAVTLIERFVADYAGGWSLVFVGALFIAIVLAMPRGIAYYLLNPSVVRYRARVLARLYRSSARNRGG